MVFFWKNIDLSLFSFSLSSSLFFFILSLLFLFHLLFLLSFLFSSVDLLFSSLSSSHFLLSCLVSPPSSLVFLSCTVFPFHLLLSSCLVPSSLSSSLVFLSCTVFPFIFSCLLVLYRLHLSCLVSFSVSLSLSLSVSVSV